ncbi:hypothetical protein KFL_001460080 [Klebsormidium nitens]|uniref:Uncharacterized protein n=1 Tax=Klebsormidium nitens TaxID=105231 RepID=A0A1Y1I2H1_KLENI|nr:hypothetical protein KFL_001460080 [Klebsormidium nitens]|eukprot:GAQ83381.1 hypothetical protein KFL_001460080 [Klebsormidium nitens]
MTPPPFHDSFPHDPPSTISPPTTPSPSSAPPTPPPVTTAPALRPPSPPPSNTARVNIANACSTPVKIVLASNQANNDFWKVYNPATNAATADVPSPFDIPAGGSRANLLLVNTDPARALSVRTGSIGATAAVGPLLSTSSTAGLDNIVINVSFANNTTTPSLSFSSFPSGPGRFAFDPAATSSPASTVAPAEIGVSCDGYLRSTLIPVGTLPVGAAAPVPTITPRAATVPAVKN